MRANEWFAIVKLAHDVWRIDEQFIVPEMRGAIYLIFGRNANLLFDSGWGLYPLHELLPNDKPLIALASHTHFDHVGGHWAFAERWVHSAEAEVLANPTPHATQAWPFLRNVAPFVRTPPVWRGPANYRLKPAPATRLIEHGAVIDLGNRQFDVLHTPGHSIGSLSLYEKKNRLLFPADAIYDGALYDTIPGASIEQLLVSHESLRQLNPKTVYPGHFQPFDGQRMADLIDAYARKQLRKG